MAKGNGKGKGKGKERDLSKTHAAKKAQIDKLIELAQASIRVRLPNNSRYVRPAAKMILQRTPAIPPTPTRQVPRVQRPISVCMPPTGPAKQPLKEFKPFSFLELPGELRNKIYAYAFPKEFFQLQWIDNGKKPRHLTYSLPNRGKLGPRLDPLVGHRRRLFDFPRRVRSSEYIPPYQLSPGPAALLLTCKKINKEATPVFYGSSTFSFHTPGTLRKFLNSVGPVSKASIQSLSIRHATAGNPVYTEYQSWKQIDDSSWEDLCWQASDDFSALIELTIDLTINDVPVLFGPLACWMLALLAFQDRGLKKCKVKLRNFTTDDAVLEVESMKLKQEILGKEFVEGEVDEVVKVVRAGPRRRVRVMNLVRP